MARTILEDFYQSHRFHLIDVTPSPSFAGFGAPFLVLSPQVGFSSITSPQLTLETEEIRPGNKSTPVTVIKSGKVEDITLQRGVFVGDNEFYQWIRQAQYGRGLYRRTLLLIHIQSELEGGADGPGPSVSVGKYLRIISRASAALAGGSGGGFFGDVASAATSAFTGFAARVFLLKDVVPVRYKAATDFDATNDGVSIAELDISVEEFTELTLGAFAFEKRTFS